MMGEKTGSKAKRDSRDLTGRQFGKLKVMERLSERESRYVVYLCRCECGNEVRVSSKKLQRGTARGCADCCPVKSNEPLDLTGQTFGELKVIALSEHRKEGRRTWECLCSCGKKVRVTTHDLRSGHCVSCGASEHKIGRAFSDLTGKRIGKLLVQASTDKRDKKGSVIWKCRCDCGQECEYSQDSLIHGGVVSCGCYRRTVNVAWDMHVTYPGQYLTYEQNWLEFITRFNEILPTMPIYSNIYFDFFTDWLQNYEPATYYSWPVAILYAYYAEPEEPVEVTPLPGEEETEAPAGDDEIIIID